MKRFKVLHKSTDQEPIQTLGGCNVKINYLIDDELNVWEVFKGDSEIVIEKNSDLYVQFENMEDINRLQKLKADHHKIESGTHGFAKDGSMSKHGIKARPTFTICK